MRSKEHPAVIRWRLNEYKEIDYDLLQRKFKSYRFNIYLLNHVVDVCD